MASGGYFQATRSSHFSDSLSFPRMSLASCITEYIKAMIDKVSGIKILLLDSETAGIISLVFSQSQILEKEIFLVERIDSTHREPIRHLKAIFFVRPNADNFLRLLNDLKSPLYSEYHFFFSNVVPPTQLERLARADELEVVKQVHEFFADIFVLNDDLFSLNLPSVSGLFKPVTLWDAYEESLFQRIVDGLFSLFCALNFKPLIRYQKSSDVCAFVAKKLCTLLEQESELFRKNSNIIGPPAGAKNCVLLLIDRREDPVTPLLNQWTYRSMLHELIGIENNRTNMSKAPGIKKELEEIVMSPMYDQFYKENFLSNFGQLGYSVKKYLEAYQEKSQSTAKMESLEDMQKFVEIYPEFQKLSGNVSKHVAVIHELSRLVEVNGLLEVSLLEQELACRENITEHQKVIVEKFKSGEVQPMELLRLVLLYALRYEGHPSVSKLKMELQKLGVPTEQVNLVDAIIRYGGSDVRSGDLFQNKNLLALAKSTIQRGFKGTPNVYTQHQSQLAETLELLVKGRLRESSFPYASGSISHPASVNAKERSKAPTNVIIFVVGGATYEEAREVENFDQTACRVIFGGTTMLNSRIFLADVAQLVKSKTSNELPWVQFPVS